MPWTTPKTWAAGEVLTAANLNLYLRDNTEILGASRPSARVYQTGTQTLTTGTQTTLTFDTETFDIGSTHSTSVNTERLTAPNAGLYLVVATLGMAANGTGFRRLTIFNQSAAPLASQVITPSGSWQHEQTVTAITRLAANDYVYAQAQQTSGGNLATVATYTSLSFFWIGAY